MKAHTWAELSWPTPDQWLDWLLDQEHADQLVIAERVLDSAMDAQACIVQGHSTLLWALWDADRALQSRSMSAEQRAEVQWRNRLVAERAEALAGLRQTVRNAWAVYGWQPPSPLAIEDHHATSREAT